MRPASLSTRRSPTSCPTTITLSTLDLTSSCTLRQATWQIRTLESTLTRSEADFWRICECCLTHLESNMANQNTGEYVDKIRSRLLENLRMLPHAPGVQMADIPEDSVNLDKEDEEVDAADSDKRGNMKLMDQGREADNEFEEGKSGNKNEKNHGETNGDAAEPMDTSGTGS